MNTHLKHLNSLIIILKHNHLRFPKTYWYIHNNRMDFNAPNLNIQRTKYFLKIILLSLLSSKIII